MATDTRSETLDRTRTPLLALITQDALDRDYVAAAARRAERASEKPTERAGRRVAVLAVVAAFALLVTVAAVQTSRDADVHDASRNSLIERIEARRTVVGNLQEQIAELRAANTTAESNLQALSDRFADVQDRTLALGALTGFEPATGPGVRFTLDNADNADRNEIIRDSDLVLLVNGLWAAGAEAVAINGQRVTGVAGITTAGLAIEVNGIGIAPPYTVVAIGDGSSLAADFVDTASGLQFIALARQYGFDYDMDNDRELHLPAARASLRILQSAKAHATNGNRGDDR